MPRPVRVHIEGALYAVTSQAMEGVPLFRETQDYETYLQFLQEAKQRFSFRLYAFVLLPSEVRLLLEPTNGATVSAIMHALNSRYTKYVGKRHDHTGHIFRSRFAMTLMEKAPSVLYATAVLHQLPNAAGVAQDFGAYAWSSYPSYLAVNGSSIGPITSGEVREVQDMLSRTHPGQTYEQAMASLTAQELRQWQQAMERPVVGSEEFLRRVEEQRRQRQETTGGGQVARWPGGHDTTTGSLGRFATKSPMVTAALAVTAVAVVSVILSVKTVSTFRANVNVIGQEEHAAAVFLKSIGSLRRAEATSAQLAMFNQRASLEGTAWDLTLSSLSPASGTAAKHDHLAFTDHEIASSLFSAQGFPSSNYTATRNANGEMVWETMQSKPSGAVVRWRGEWRDQVMRGVLTHQDTGKSPEEYTFVGVLKDQTHRKEI
ncbi:MAG: transposase [Candidatus Omnitrophica bacterium]|nr:transposase [Candidatus Omnitrophota bacterium]